MPWVPVYRTKRALKGRQNRKAMPQSLAKIYTHLVFSTKHREPRLTDGLRAGLHAYMGGTLRQYIRNQREHHKRVSFQDEFRAFLRRYEVEYDERYVWD
jgi:hypothetical protein